MPMPDTPRVAIIGGGITGLAAAWELQKHGIDYTLFEASDRLGGKIVTEQIDGFTIEGGPDSFLSNKPWAWQLCDELGLRDRIIGTNDAHRNVFVLKDGTLHPFPKGMRLIVPVDPEGLLASDLISDEGKRRMLAEVDLPPYDAPEDESMASFVRRHFGQEALDIFAEPLLAGIYVGDPEKMSIRATYPNYVEMERTHGSLIRAMREAPPAPIDPRAPKTTFFSLKGGCQELVDTLVSKLTGDIRTGSSRHSPSHWWLAFTNRVKRISHVDSGYELIHSQNEHFNYSKFFAKSVIDTSGHHLYPNDSLHKYFLPLLNLNHASQQLAENRISEEEVFTFWRLHKLEYYFSSVRSTTVSLGFHKDDVPNPLDGFGLVIPRFEPTNLTAITFSSTKILGRSPYEYILIRGFFSDRRRNRRTKLEHDTYDGALSTFRRELEKLFGITAPPIVRKVNYWQNPQYGVGYPDFLARIEALMPPGFYMAGSAYRGVGVPDCIHQAQIVARKAIAHLSGKNPDEIDYS